jgi:hypothetical protein
MHVLYLLNHLVKFQLQTFVEYFIVSNNFFKSLRQMYCIFDMACREVSSVLVYLWLILVL